MNMNKLTYRINQKNTSGVDETTLLEFTTYRTPEWTENQYLRNRKDCTMELLSEDTTDVTKAGARYLLDFK